MSAQHTPGPWRATVGRDQMADMGTTICHSGKWGIYSDAEAHGDDKADARLIAAAPDLLELVQNHYRSLQGGYVMTFSEADEEWMRRVLAKATGGAA